MSPPARHPRGGRGGGPRRPLHRVRPQPRRCRRPPGDRRHGRPRGARRRPARRRRRSCTWGPGRRCRGRSRTRSPRTGPTPPAPSRCWRACGATGWVTWWWRRRRPCTGATPRSPSTRGSCRCPCRPTRCRSWRPRRYALAHARCFGFGALAFRFFNVFGPLQAAGHAYAAVVPAFVSAAIAGEPVTVHGDGGQTRDFTYVGSVCEVIATAVRRGRGARRAGEPRLRGSLVAPRAARRAGGAARLPHRTDARRRPAPATCATARPTRRTCGRCSPPSRRSTSTTGSTARSSGSRRER